MCHTIWMWPAWEPAMWLHAALGRQELVTLCGTVTGRHSHVHGWMWWVDLLPWRMHGLSRTMARCAVGR